MSMTDEEYLEILERSGVAVEIDDPDSLLELCKHLMRSAERGVLWRESNLVAAVWPEVANVIRLGAVNSGKDVLLVVPPLEEIGGLVRDALWIEAQAAEGKSKPWIKGAGEIARAIESAFDAAELSLGPLSDLCLQDKPIAIVEPKAMFAASGREIDDDPDRHEHDAWQRVRVDLPTGGRLLTFLSFDMCSECGATARQSVRLGLGQALKQPLRHTHRWVDFASPVPDDKGYFAVVRGEVCTAPERTLGQPPCGAVRSVKTSRSRTPGYMPPPAWVKRSRLRAAPSIHTPRSHEHLWDEMLVGLTPGASLLGVKCATCRATYLSNDVSGAVPDEYKRLVIDPLKRSGGFAETSDQKLREVLDRASRTFGPDVMSAFGDILASAACEYGLVGPTEADVDRAFRAARVEREGKRRSGWRAAKFSLADGEAAGFVLDDTVGVYEVADGWEIVHLGVRRRISFEKGEIEARHAAEDAVADEFEPDLQAGRVAIEDWRIVGSNSK
jgi:hypothetical protein